MYREAIAIVNVEQEDIHAIKRKIWLSKRHSNFDEQANRHLATEYQKVNREKRNRNKNSICTEGMELAIAMIT